MNPVNMLMKFVNMRFFLSVVLGFVLFGVTDLILWRVFPHARLAAEVIDIQQPSQLVSKLDFLRYYEGLKVVVIGDSLIYGRTMEAHGDPGWRNHTLDATLENKLREVRPREKILVFNLGINGALPTDLEALARLIIPCRIDLLIMDTHLRPFSRDFSVPGAEICRPWLRHIGVDREGGLAWVPDTGSWRERVGTILPTFLFNHWALYRYRDVIQANAAQCGLLHKGGEIRRRFNRWRTDREEVDEDVLLLLKLKQRLQTVNFEMGNPQRQALERMVSYLNEKNQKTIIFYARENPDLLPQLMSDEKYQQLCDNLAGIIRAGGGDTVVYAPVVAALNAEHYLDFSHLNALGYKKVAEGLLEYIKRLNVI
ncbi:MAG: hypothetical protein V1809_16085 [Planctomycetota bacterium]